MHKMIIGCAVAIVSIAALVAAMLALTGCNDDSTEGETSNCVVVCGKRQNSAASALLAQGEVEPVVQSGGYFDIVRADGNPTSALGAGSVQAVDDENDKTRERDEEKLLLTLLAQMRDTTAEVAEVDIAAALDYANRSLASAPERGFNTVAVCDSGVSTAGLIDFTSDGLISAEAESFVDYLKQNGQLANYDNIDRVVWYGFGDVSDAQEEIPQNVKANMQAIYTTYLNAAGVDDVVFADNIAQTLVEDSSALPSVTTVHMPSTPKFQGVGTTVKLNQAQLSFVGDKAEFVDETAACEVLARYASALAENPGFTAVVKGYTASYPSDPSWPTKLSAMRAEKVRDVLVKLGADASQVSASGEGTGPIADLDSNGRQIENLARQNRYVEISFA